MFIMFSQILGGAGLLLYGIEIMKDSLELISQGKGQKFLEVTGKNRFMCIFAGIFVTAVNQKSSATTITVVGLVNAGMITLVQATGVIMGANIGTTITAQLLAFRLEYIAPLIIGIGAIVWRIARTKRMEYTAEIFLGFGIMFVGVTLMEMGMGPISKYHGVQTFFTAFTEIDMTKYLLIIAVGFALTALVHSSSLITGVMIAMAGQGLLPSGMIIPMILGVNVGKCIPALLSSRGLSRTAKRAAVINLLFNLSGVIVIVLFLQNISLDFIQSLSPKDLPRQVANAHTLFNAGSAILCLPFTNLLSMASDRLVPSKSTAAAPEWNLDIRMLETPGLALAQVYGEIIRLAKMAFSSYDMSFHCVQDSDAKDLLNIRQMEDTILKTEKEIEIYLVKLAQKKISKNQHETLNLMLGVSGDIERISDLSINIGELALYNRENSIHFSEDARKEIQAFQDQIEASIHAITNALETRDGVLANQVLSSEINIRNLAAEIRENHIERLSTGACNPGFGVLYMDIVNSMEHVAEHIKKIGYFLIEVLKH